MDSIWYYLWTDPKDVYNCGLVFPFRSESEAIDHANQHHAHHECEIITVLFSEVCDVYTGE